jgi:hypothetical protein
MRGGGEVAAETTTIVASRPLPVRRPCSAVNKRSHESGCNMKSDWTHLLVWGAMIRLFNHCFENIMDCGAVGCFQIQEREKLNLKYNLKWTLRDFSLSYS